jgi:hypothetical protein
MNATNIFIKLNNYFLKFYSFVKNRVLHPLCPEYLDEHKEVLLRYNARCNKSCVANEHMRKFIG